MGLDQNQILITFAAELGQSNFRLCDSILAIFQCFAGLIFRSDMFGSVCCETMLLERMQSINLRRACIFYQLCFCKA